MKYFTHELWHQFSSNDKSEREIAALTWENNAKAYQAYLRKIAKRIPHDTMVAINEIAEGNVPLHDFRFSGITFSSAESTTKKMGRPPQFYKRVCCLQLTDGVTNVELVMSDVKKISMEVAYGKENDAFDIHWGYCEFAYHKPNVVLSVLCDSGHTWQFAFSSLSINTSNTQNENDIGVTSN